MIKTLADRLTRELYVTGKSKWFPPDRARWPARKLEYIDPAKGLDDLKVPPENRLHPRQSTGVFWLNAQRAVDQWDAARTIEKYLRRIRPLTAA